MSDLPSAELTWLYSHCRAIGMDCKSESGLWEHDIALFTINQKQKIEELEEELANALFEIKNQEAELKDWVRALEHEAELEIEVEELKKQLWVSRISAKLLQDSIPAS